MAMNPAELFKLRERFNIFNEQHPRVVPFFNAAAGRIQEGSVIEITVTSPDGESIASNIRVTAEDLETVEILKNAGSNM